MKHLLVVAYLIAWPASADDFAARVADAKRASSSSEGAKYDASLGPHIGAAIRACIPPGSNDPANLGSFSLVGRVTATGALKDIEVEPRTKVSLCFADRFGRSQLQSPPGNVGSAGYPVLVEMRINP
jgi:hypothetical protein